MSNVGLHTVRSDAMDDAVLPSELEKVAIIAMYCHLSPPDTIAFGASNLNCRRTQCRCGPPR